jgi:hypothetical protein
MDSGSRENYYGTAIGDTPGKREVALLKLDIGDATPEILLNGESH